MDKLFERIWHHIWSFLTVNIGTKLVSIAIAIVLWIVVLGSRNVEVTKEVPLEVITPSNLVPANEIPDRIAFRLSGPKAFLRAVLDRHEEPIRVNLAGAKPGLVTYRFFSDNIRVPIGVKVLSINPTAILIKLEYLRRREVPVRLVMDGEPADGYHVAKTELQPPTVKIKGSESRVDAVSEIPTLPVDISGAKQPIHQAVGLELSQFNVQLDSQTPTAFIDIEPQAANYRIKNVDIRVLSSHHARLEEKTVTVLVRANPNDLTHLDKAHVYALIDLRGKPKGRYVEPLNVKLPPGITLVKAVPDRIVVNLY